MTEATRRARGRPRAFDEGEVLDAAVRVFWAKGFEGASLDDLTAATGLARPSLYGAFGDKEALFLRCLDRYSETVGARARAALEAEAAPQAAIGAYLRQAVLNATEPGDPAGCLMGCVATAVERPSVKRLAIAAMTGAGTMIARRLADAVAAGDLPAGFPVASRARRVVDASMALGLRARAGAPREELLADAADAAALALGPV